MTEYTTIISDTPPVLRVINGEIFVEIIFDGGTTVRASVGDGSWFFSQVVTKLVDPALRAAYPRGEFISPND